MVEWAAFGGLLSSKDTADLSDTEENLQIYIMTQLGTTFCALHMHLMFMTPCLVAAPMLFMTQLGTTLHMPGGRPNVGDVVVSEVTRIETNTTQACHLQQRQ